MSVSYWGDAIKHRTTFHILKDQKDVWIMAGYGGVEIYDDPEGFPEYRYSASVLTQIKAWYEKHVPKNDRKR